MTLRVNCRDTTSSGLSMSELKVQHPGSRPAREPVAFGRSTERIFNRPLGGLSPADCAY
jgi:hypothetical protein